MLTSSFTSVILVLTLITGLLTISYWVGVAEIEELSEDDDIFRDF